jgi:hypothetical protein
MTCYITSKQIQGGCLLKADSVKAGALLCKREMIHHNMLNFGSDCFHSGHGKHFHLPKHHIVNIIQHPAYHILPAATEFCT